MEKNSKMLELLKGNFEEDENGIGLSLGLSIGGNYNNKDCNSDDKILVERQRSQKRKIHREMMENEELITKQIVCRKGEIGTSGYECCTYDEGEKSLNLSLNQDSYVNDQNHAVPIWAQQNDGKREMTKKKAIQGEDCRGFRLYNEKWGGNMSFNRCRSNESEENLSGKSSFKNYKALSNGSTERCSSTISECQSSSPKGRSSSDNAQGNQPSTSCRKDAQFELLTSSNVMPIKEEQNQTDENIRKLSSPIKQQSQKSIKNCSMIQLLSRMPCVSATGNGPNGKTIKGLLCKYNSKTEINIVCVCHGKSFTPSEFVEHAGGVDVSQPLRHITVIPPAFDEI